MEDVFVEVNRIGKGLLNNNDFKYRNIKTKLNGATSNNSKLENTVIQLESELEKVKNKVKKANSIYKEDLNNKQKYYTKKIESLKSNFLLLRKFIKIEMSNYFNALSKKEFRAVENDLPSAESLLSQLPYQEKWINEYGGDCNLGYIFYQKKIILKLNIRLYYDRAVSYTHLTLPTKRIV